MSLKAICAAVQTGLVGVGAVIGAFLGGLDGLVYALIAFVVLDYITGVLAAIAERRVSSAIGFRGISRKILIFTLIGLAHLLDMHVIGTSGALRTATVVFYLANGRDFVNREYHLSRATGTHPDSVGVGPRHPGC